MVEDSGFSCIIQSNDYHFVLCRTNTACYQRDVQDERSCKRNSLHGKNNMWQWECHKVHMVSTQRIPVHSKIIKAELIPFLKNFLTSFFQTPLKPHELLSIHKNQFARFATLKALTAARQSNATR